MGLPHQAAVDELPILRILCSSVDFIARSISRRVSLTLEPFAAISELPPIASLAPG
jgi:hypothetical protein